MKFHWFAEVTYPHLPADFPKRYRSAWVDPPPSLMDPQKVGETYRMFIRLMEQADREGFDGLAVNEHHQTAYYRAHGTAPGSAIPRPVETPAPGR